MEGSGNRPRGPACGGDQGKSGVMGDWVCGALRGKMLRTEVGTDPSTLGPPEAAASSVSRCPRSLASCGCVRWLGASLSLSLHSVGQGMAAT